MWGSYNPHLQQLNRNSDAPSKAQSPFFQQQSSSETTIGFEMISEVMELELW